MEGIKETKTKKIIKFLLDHIMVISAIIFLCILLFSSCSTAKAAESITYNSYMDYLEDYGAFTTYPTLRNTIETWGNNYPLHSLFYQPTKRNSTAYFDFILIFYLNDNFYGLPASITGSVGYNLYSPINSTNVNRSVSVKNSNSISVTTNTYIIRYLVGMNNKIYGGGILMNANTTYRPTLNNNNNSYEITNLSYYYFNDVGEGVNTPSGSLYFSRNLYDNILDIPYLSNFDLKIKYDTFGFHTFVENEKKYTEDNRLRMYITNAIGGPRLNVNVVDFAQSFPYPDQTVLQPKEITLTIETDGVESLFTLDPSTAIWASKYWATVPVSDIANLDGHDVVKITKVEFTMYDAFANMTEDFYIATDFTLKDTTEEIDPSNILPPGNIYEDAKTTAQIDLLIQILEANGSGSIYGDFTFQSTIPILPAWSDEIYTDLTRMDDNSPNFAGHWYDHYPWSFGDLQIDPYVYINEFCKGYASVYDVIIFRVYGWYYDPSFGGDDPAQGSYTTGVKGYIVLYTNKFYNHSSSLTTLDILTAIQSDFNQQKSNWNWLVSKINDFESKSLEAMNAELRVERDSRDWLKSIWNQIENLEMPIYDDSDLLDKLDLIISELDEIAGFFTGESGEGYNRFTEWLEKIENDGEITPHEWANNIFNYVTGLYHSLSDGTSYYTDDITDYINYVNQDGNSDPGNYFFAMYDGTYNPHNYYGWTGGLS